MRVKGVMAVVAGGVTSPSLKARACRSVRVAAAPGWRYSDAVVFLQFGAHLPKGAVSAKVGDDALQRQGVASTADFGDGGKRAMQFAVPLADIGLLDDHDFTEGTVPVQFFYLSHHGGVLGHAPRLFVRQSLPPAAQQLLPHRSQFVNRPTLGIIGPAQVATRILDQLQQFHDARLHDRMAFQPPGNVFCPLPSCSIVHAHSRLPVGGLPQIIDTTASHFPVLRLLPLYSSYRLTRVQHFHL